MGGAVGSIAGPGIIGREGAKPIGPAPGGKVITSEQFGFWTAAFTIVRKRNILQNYASKYDVDFIKVGSGAAQREAMIAGKLHFAIQGFAPFVLGWAKGVPWRVAQIVTAYTHTLTTNLQTQTLDEFVKMAQQRSQQGKSMKIASPSPFAANHIALMWTLKEAGYAADELNKYVVGMSHPEAYRALLSGEIQAHLTSPPYEGLEAEQAMTMVKLPPLKSAPKVERVGLWPINPPTGIMPNAVLVVSEKFYQENREAYSVVIDAISEGQVWATLNPKDAATMLAPEEKMEPDKAYNILTKWLRYVMGGYDPEAWFLSYIDFMNEIGLIDRKAKSIDDIALPNVSQPLLKGWKT